MVKVYILLVSLMGVALADGAEQTDWSGEPDVFGPVVLFGSNYFESEGVDALTVPGTLWAAFGTEVVLSDWVNGACVVCPADFDGDGDLDVATAAWNGIGHFYWLENTSGLGDDWLLHFVSSGYPNPYPLSVGDVDGDGAQDLVGASWAAGLLSFWRNADGQGTSWEVHSIPAGLVHPTCTELFDVNQDGDLDIICTDQELGLVLWLENENGSGEIWTVHTVDISCSGARHVCSLDFDGDGDWDLVASSFQDNAIYIYDNQDGSGGIWSRSLVGTATDTYHIAVADLDGDGDPDLLDVGFLSDIVRWWENQSEGIWMPHIVASNIDGARSVHPADLDGDGDPDVLVSAVESGLVYLFENDGGQCINWSGTVVTTGLGGACDARAADLNGDSFLDVVAAGPDNDLLKWINLSGYQAVSTLTSSVLDLGLGPVWGSIYWTSEEPTGTHIGFRIRASSNYTDMGPWSVEISSPGWLSPYLEDGERYVQYMACLHSSGAETPTLEDVTISWNQLDTGDDQGIEEFALLGPVRNPVVGSVDLEFAVPALSEVEIVVFNLAGRVVAAPVRGEYSQGVHKVHLEGLMTGVYLCRMRAEGFVDTARFSVVR